MDTYLAVNTSISMECKCRHQLLPVVSLQPPASSDGIEPHNGNFGLPKGVVLERF